jgi:hypothetical protein
VRLRSFLLDLAALALVLLAPFIVLLSFHGYSYLTAEFLLILAAALGAAALLALPVGASRLLRALALGALLALFIDLHVSWPQWSSATIALTFLAAVVGLAVIVWLLDENATKIVVVIFVTLIALTLVRGNSGADQIVNEKITSATSGDSEPPLLIHLLLDEHIGIEGLPPEMAATRELGPELTEFYTSRGFRVFGAAYSQYANTYNSIANLLNFTARQVSRPYLMHGSDGAEWDLKEAAYFEMLRQRGYRLHVYQSTYMDLCHADGVQLQECTTYPVTNLAMLQGLQLRTVEKAGAIANAIVTQSRVLRIANRLYERRIRARLLRAGWRLPAWSWQGPLFGPLQVPAVLERLRADVRRLPRGHAFFAHLIMPHYPYVFDRRCELRPRTSDWLTNRIASTDVLVYNTAESRVQKYERYAEQIRCVVTLLDDLLADLDARGLLADATIVIQGDHGSRIPLHYPSGLTLARGVLTDTDFRDTFSTLYAIRAPGVSPGYDDRPLAVVELLNQHFGGEPLSAPGSCRVFLLEEKGSGSLTAAEPKFCAP